MGKFKKSLASLLLMGSIAAPRIYQRISEYDINKDGLKDEIILEDSRKKDNQRYRFKISLQRKDGSFTNPKTIFTERKKIKNIKICDLDSDGLDDIIYTYNALAVKMKRGGTEMLYTDEDPLFREYGNNRIHSMEIVDNDKNKFIVYTTRPRGKLDAWQIKKYDMSKEEAYRMKELTPKMLGKNKIEKFWVEKNKVHYLTTNKKEKVVDL